VYSGCYGKREQNPNQGFPTPAAGRRKEATMATYPLLPMEDVKDAAAAAFAKVAHLPVQPAWVVLYTEDAAGVYSVQVTPAGKATAYPADDHVGVGRDGRREVSFR
jgi:hypothetical protein